MLRKLSVIGVSHRTAPVAVRERVAVPGELTGRVLRALRAGRAVEEAVVLDTCNRTELYAVAPAEADLPGLFLAAVGQAKDAPPPELDPAVVYRHDGSAAVRHLLRVAASLDSQIVGENEILGQVKRAFRLAVEARTTRLLTNRLFHAAFRAGKRVRTETDLGRGASSVARAAVDLAGQVFGSLAERTVLLVGAGEAAADAARTLLAAEATRLLVTNRTPERAEALVASVLAPRGEACAPEEAKTPAVPEGVTATVRPYDALAEAAAEADLVCCSTGAEAPVLTKAALAAALGRSDRSLVVLDLAVPRDVEPAASELPNVFLYTLDDLDRLVERNLEARRAEVPRAEAIVEDEAAALARWTASRGAVPTVRELLAHVERLRADEVRQHAREFADADREHLDAFTQHLVKRLLHKPLAFLRGADEEAALSRAMERADAIRRIFDLDARQPDGPDPGEEDDA